MQSVSKRHAIPVLYPVDDALSGTVSTDIVEVQGEGVLFEITKGIGATGTSTVTVLSCDDVAPTTSVAVPFMHRASTTPDTWGDWTQVTTAGFALTAGSNQMYQVYVDSQRLAANNYGYAQLVATEVVDSPVAAGINAYIENARYVEPQESLID